MNIQLKQKHIDRALDFYLTENAGLADKCPLALALKEHTHKPCKVYDTFFKIGNRRYRHNNQTHIIVQTYNAGFGVDIVPQIVDI